MFYRFLFGLLILSLISTSKVYGFQQNENLKNVEYAIEALFDTEQNYLIGSERITWKNLNSVSTSEIYFHLYWNAFDDSKREEIVDETENDPAQTAGFIGIDQISILNGPDLSSSISYVNPAGEILENRTVCRVILPGRVAPGESVELLIEFRAIIPHMVYGAGYLRRFTFADSWYPKVGVYSNGEWICPEYHGGKQLNRSNLSEYEVDLTIPGDYIVGATGELHNKIITNGYTTYTYHQEGVTDFVWTADPDFLEYNDVFGKTDNSEIKLTLLIQPEHVERVSRIFGTIKHALSVLEDWFGGYPYSTLTIVEPEYSSFRMNRSEFPTMITSPVNWLILDHVLEPEQILIRNLVDNYYYSILNSADESNDDLKEGIAQFFTVKILNDLAEEDFSQDRTAGILQHIENALILCKSPFCPFGGNKGYPGTISFARQFDKSHFQFESLLKCFYSTGDSSEKNLTLNIPLFLSSLERSIGGESAKTIFKTFCERWQSGDLNLNDFKDVLTVYAGNNWNQFFTSVMNDETQIDLEVSEIFNEDVSEQGTGHLYDSSVVFRRTEDMNIPIDIKVIFEDGEATADVWDNGLDEFTITFSRDSKILRAEIDPDRKILLDINIKNNSLSTKKSFKNISRQSGGFLFQIQNLFHLLSCII